jgi:hypothetical protein
MNEEELERDMDEYLKFDVRRMKMEDLSGVVYTYHADM